MAPGVAGVPPTLTASDAGADVPQRVVAVTLMFPPAPPAVTVMLFVVEAPVQPVGNVHVYPVAPPTAAMLYVCVVPVHTAVAPLMFPGAPGAAPEVTASEDGAVVPQLPDAVTEIVPPAVVGVTVMEEAVEVPVQPVGNVHT